MTYELAKQLKDAGFQQWGENVGIDGAKITVWAIPGDDCYVPTLDELLEACGERFKSLWRHSSGTWTACYGTRRIVPRRKTDGATPTEAVARLWLEIQKA